MGSQLLTIKVLEALAAEYGGLYTRHNVAISGTHTHAGPGGFLQYFAYSMSALGLVRQTFDAMKEGVLESVRRAHADLRPARVSVAEGDLVGAAINRSPTAYAANPEAERARYASDVDTLMTMLRVHEAQDGDGDGSSISSGGGAAAGEALSSASSSGAAKAGEGRGRGLLNWFAVHPTSMNNSNPYVSGDNKGAAELFTERWAARRPGLGPGFVAAFAATNLGDTTPNTLGAFCYGTGERCDIHTSTCGGGALATNSLCFGRGPGW